jgi:hypothetical protein
MPLAAGLLTHAVTLWAFVLFVPSAGVAAAAWVVVYVAGALYLVATQLVPRLRLSVAQALRLLGYSVLVATLFFGANLALTALGNSVKPRQPLPSALGGLELWYLLVPGVAAVALASVVFGLLRRKLSSPPSSPAVGMRQT